ncbi:MAG: 16S rRNA (guanine(527)-N(7))-methyltransferase RsmG [Planctomycetaceae bacterium]
MSDDLAGAIAAECAALGIVVGPDAMPRLAAYAASLWSWNERLNLTRHVDAATFVSRDVADAAGIAPHLAHGERVLDVGTGGGVPGVVLAILRPDLRVELCDSVAKKARAVAEIVRTAGIALPIHAAAAQTVVAGRPSGADRFDTLIARAVAPLAKLLGWFEPVASSFGRLLVVKGPRWEEERDDARYRGLTNRVSIRRLASWPIRGRDHESVLIEIGPRSAS